MGICIYKYIDKHHWCANGDMSVGVSATHNEGEQDLITMTSYERHGVSTHRQLDRLFEQVVHANKRVPHYFFFARGMHRWSGDSSHRGGIAKSITLSWRLYIKLRQTRNPMRKTSKYLTSVKNEDNLLCSAAFTMPTRPLKFTIYCLTRGALKSLE